MTDLRDRVALVTGASRGVGRGIAKALADAGAAVYGTGRSIGDAELPASVRRIPCDHTADEAVAAVFERIRAESGRLDILVNNAWGGYERMLEDGRFTWPVPFWEQPLWRWDAMLGAGVRESGVAVVSLYPGLVRTEAVLAAGVFDLRNSESPEFLGRVVGALATERDLMRRSGQVVVAAAVARERGILDVDGRSPEPLNLADA
jgi:NAD(P)-dependent dehydrogenase (short-subunit alcohol dehydrogenase family)